MIWWQKYYDRKDWVFLLVWHGAVTRCRVFQQPHSRLGAVLIPRKINVSFHVEFEAIWEDEWNYNVVIASDHSKRHDVDWVFAFRQYQYILVGLGTGQANGCYMSSPSDSEKNQSRFGWRGYSSWFKSFAARSFLLSLMLHSQIWV